jgi:hypothetical protein
MPKSAFFRRGGRGRFSHSYASSVGTEGLLLVQTGKFVRKAIVRTERSRARARNPHAACGLYAKRIHTPNHVSVRPIDLAPSPSFSRSFSLASPLATNPQDDPPRRSQLASRIPALSCRAGTLSAGATTGTDSSATATRRTSEPARPTWGRI